MSGASTKRLTVLAVTLVLAGSVVVLIFSHQTSIHIKVLDPRLHVLSARMLHGNNDHFYDGNQLEGRVRDFLQLRAHLPVKPLLNLGRVDSVRGPYDPSFNPNDPNRYAFAIRFSWDSGQRFAIPRGLGATLLAVLVDSSGKVFSTGSGSFGGSNPYFGVFFLDHAPRDAGSYRLRLRLIGTDMRIVAGTNDDYIAEAEMKNLPAVPAHLRYNSGSTTGF